VLLECCWSVAGVLLECCWSVAGVFAIVMLVCCWSVQKRSQDLRLPRKQEVLHSVVALAREFDLLLGHYLLESHVRPS
jgi:hypothetical protein